VRINERIRVREIRVIDDGGQQLGIMPPQQALAIARQKGLDLVEVAANADPPVARVMDYSKYRYEQEQRAKQARKHQLQIQIKEIKLRPKIGKHDYETKKGHVVRFLEAGARVKVTIMFRGREMAHTELGQRILDRLVEDLDGLATVEQPAKLDGRNMVMVLAPTKKPAPRGRREPEPAGTAGPEGVSES